MRQFVTPQSSSNCALHFDQPLNEVPLRPRKTNSVSWSPFGAGGNNLRAISTNGTKCALPFLARDLGIVHVS